MGPLVRAADAVSGEAVGMRVDLTLASGQEAVGLYVHRCVAAHYQTFASADSLLCALVLARVQKGLPCFFLMMYLHRQLLHL